MSEAFPTVLALTIALAASAAWAQMPMGGKGSPPKSTTTPWATQNDAAMAQMDKAMSSTPPVSDEDHAFVEGMLPHHQGAVDMARVELAFGHDPHLRRLAHSIIAAQEREIGIMHAWLKAHPEAS